MLKLILAAQDIIGLDMENDGATMDWPELQSAIAKLKEAVAEAIKENGNKIPQDKTTLQKIIDKEVDQKRLQYLSAAERITYLESKNSEDSKDRIIASDEIIEMSADLDGGGIWIMDIDRYRSLKFRPPVDGNQRSLYSNDGDGGYGRLLGRRIAIVDFEYFGLAKI